MKVDIGQMAVLLRQFWNLYEKDREKYLKIAEKAPTDASDSTMAKALLWDSMKDILPAINEAKLTAWPKTGTHQMDELATKFQKLEREMSRRMYMVEAAVEGEIKSSVEAVLREKLLPQDPQDEEY